MQVIDAAAGGELYLGPGTAGPAGPRVVVNTHHHGDHVFGNGVFAGQAAIVAHERCRSEMAEAGLGLQGLWPDVDWGVDELTLPTLTFSGRLTLHVGDLQDSRLDRLDVVA